MEKKAWALIALLGGILLIVGVFLPWVKALDPSNPTLPAVEKSAWDAADVIAISGSIMVLLGALAVWGFDALRSMVPVGGLLALVEAIAVYKAPITTEAVYGIWVFIVGAIIALIATIGIISTKK